MIHHESYEGRLTFTISTKNRPHFTKIFKIREKQAKKICIFREKVSKKLEQRLHAYTHNSIQVVLTIA